MDRALQMEGKNVWMRGLAILALIWLLVLAAGCLSPSGESPGLSGEAVRQTIDSWNPSFARAIDFYGLHFPEGKTGNSATAYLLLTSPADKEKKLVVFEAHLRRLQKNGEQQQWYITALVSHGLVGGQRLGWDNLMAPVKEVGTKP